MKTRNIQLNELQATIILHMIEREATDTMSVKHSSEDCKLKTLTMLKKMHDAIAKPFDDNDYDPNENMLEAFIEHCEQKN